MPHLDLLRGFFLAIVRLIETIANDLCTQAQNIGCLDRLLLNRALALEGVVIAASATGSPALVECLLEQPQAEEIVSAFKDTEEVTTERQLKDAVGIPWAVVAAGREVNGNGTGDLLLEVGIQDRGRRCSNEEGHDGDAENPAAPKSDSMEGAIAETEIETASGARDICMQRSESCGIQSRLGLVPCVQSNFIQIIHAHSDKCLHRHLREQKSSAVKQPYVPFTRFR